MFDLNEETVRQAEEVVRRWLQESNNGSVWIDPNTKAEREKLVSIAMRVLEIAADLEGIKESVLKRQSIGL